MSVMRSSSVPRGRGGPEVMRYPSVPRGRGGPEVMRHPSVPRGRGDPEVMPHPSVPRSRAQPNFAACITPHRATPGQPQLVQRNGKVFYAMIPNHSATAAGSRSTSANARGGSRAREQERPRASDVATPANHVKPQQPPPPTASSTNKRRVPSASVSRSDQRRAPSLSRSEQHQQTRYHVGSSPSSALRAGDAGWGTPAQMNFAPHPRTPSSNFQQGVDYLHPPSAGAIYHNRGGIAEDNQNQHIHSVRNANNSTTPSTNNFGLHHQHHYRSAGPRVPMGSFHGGASPMVHPMQQHHRSAVFLGAPPSSPFHHSAVPASPMNPMFAAQSAGEYAREVRGNSQYGGRPGTPSRVPSYNYMDQRQQMMMSHMNMVAGTMPGTPGHHVGGPLQSPHAPPSSMMFPGHDQGFSHSHHHPYNVTPNTTCTVGMSPGGDGEDFPRFYGGGAEESSQYDHGQHQLPGEGASMMANPGQGDHGGDGFIPMDSQEQQEDAPQNKSSRNFYEQTKNRPEDSSSSKCRHEKKLPQAREQSLDRANSQQSLHMQDAGPERTHSSKLGAFLEHRTGLPSDHPQYSPEATNNGMHQRSHDEPSAELRSQGNLMAPPTERPSSARAKSRDESFPPITRDASDASWPRARTNSNGRTHARTPEAAGHQARYTPRGGLIDGQRGGTTFGGGEGPSLTTQHQSSSGGLLPAKLATQVEKARQSKRAGERLGPVHDTFQPWMRLGEKETKVCLGVRGEGSYLTVLDPRPKHKYYMCTFCGDNKLFSSPLAIRNHLNTCDKLVVHKTRNEVWPEKLKMERMQRKASEHGDSGHKNGADDAKEFPPWATAQTVSLGDNPALTKLQDAEIDMVEKLTLPKEVEQNRWPSKLESDRMARQLEEMNGADATAGASGNARGAAEAIGSGGEGKNRKRTADNKTFRDEPGQASAEGKKATNNRSVVVDRLSSEVDPLADPLGYMQRSIANALQTKLQNDMCGKKGYGTMSKSKLIAMISNEPGVVAARQRLSRLGILDEYWEAGAAAAYCDTIGNHREFGEDIGNKISVPSSTASGNDPEKISAHAEQQEERRRIVAKRTQELKDWAKRNQGGAVRMGRTFEITDTATCHGNDASSKTNNTKACKGVNATGKGKENHKEDKDTKDNERKVSVKKQRKLQQEKATSSTCDLSDKLEEQRSTCSNIFKKQAVPVPVERVDGGDRDSKARAAATPSETPSFFGSFCAQPCPRLFEDEQERCAVLTSAPAALFDKEQARNPEAEPSAKGSLTATSSKPNKRKRLTPHPSDGSYPEEPADPGLVRPNGNGNSEVTSGPPPKPKAKARGKRKIAKKAAQGGEQSALAKRRGITEHDNQTAGHGRSDAASNSTSIFLAALLGRERASKDDCMTALIQSSPWQGSSDVEETSVAKKKNKDEAGDIKVADVEITKSGNIDFNAGATADDTDAGSKTAIASTVTPSPEKHGTPNVLEIQQDQKASGAISSSSAVKNSVNEASKTTPRKQSEETKSGTQKNGEAHQISTPAPKKRRDRPPKGQANNKDRSGHGATATTSASATSLENQSETAKTQALDLGKTKKTEEDYDSATAPGPTPVAAAKENAKPKAKGRPMKVAKAKAKRSSKTSCAKSDGNSGSNDKLDSMVEVVEARAGSRTRTDDANGAKTPHRENENLQKVLGKERQEKTVPLTLPPEMGAAASRCSTKRLSRSPSKSEMDDGAAVMAPPHGTANGDGAGGAGLGSYNLPKLFDEEPKQDSYHLPSDFDFESDEDLGLQPKSSTKKSSTSHLHATGPRPTTRTKNTSKKNKKKIQSSRLDFTGDSSSSSKQKQGVSRVIGSSKTEILGTSSSSRKEGVTAPHPPPTSLKHADNEEDVNPYADSQDDVNPYATTFEGSHDGDDTRGLTTTRLRGFINAAYLEQGPPSGNMIGARLFANTTPESECGPRSPPVPKEQAEQQLYSVQCGQQDLRRKQQVKTVPSKASCTSTSNTNTAAARRRMPLWSPTKASPVTKKMRPSHSPLLPSSSSKIFAKDGAREKVPATPVSFRPEARSPSSPSVNALLSVPSHGRLRKMRRASTDNNGKDNKKGSGSGWTSCTSRTPGPLSSRAMWAESGNSRDYSARKEIDFEEDDAVLKIKA
ncbi:unnamed protein product [Amoebophrya sp. A25]|nr:unnamed protein product [Amoebophrya sp. A25]|eukprot:GSA25T00000202001.1